MTRAALGRPLLTWWRTNGSVAGAPHTLISASRAEPDAAGSRNGEISGCSKQFWRNSPRIGRKWKLRIWMPLSSVPGVAAATSSARNCSRPIGPPARNPRVTRNRSAATTRDAGWLSGYLPGSLPGAGSPTDGSPTPISRGYLSAESIGLLLEEEARATRKEVETTRS